jgi:hypothetical protein
MRKDSIDISKYGFNNKKFINRNTIDSIRKIEPNFSNLNRNVRNVIENSVTLDTAISNLNRKFQSVNENVSVIDPVVYTKNVKGVELNRQDNLNVSTKNLIPIIETVIEGFWDFPNPSGITISNFKMSFDPSETVQIDWGDGSVETIVSNTNYSHTYL